MRPIQMYERRRELLEREIVVNGVGTPRYKEALCEYLWLGVKIAKLREVVPGYEMYNFNGRLKYY